MKESRISMLMLLSMSLLLLAFAILFVWGFTYYRKAADTAPAAALITKDADANTAYLAKDSLQKIYTATINKLNAALDSTRINTDSVQVNMDAKLKEFYILKNEIDQILDNSIIAGNLGQTQKKMEVLQKRLEDWRLKNADVTEENKRLSTLLAQMNNGKKNTVPANRSVVNENITLPNPVKNGESLTVSDLQLKAMMEDKQQETQQALQTDLLQVSFIVKGNAGSAAYEEIYIVLQQPDGKVIKQSAWDSGSFETRDGRKIYSYKLRFDYQQGDNKRIHFFIESDRYQKGIYSMQVYHNGVMMGRITKSLS